MELMLTTVDNPYDPFTDFDQWLMYDMDKGYYTCNRLGALTESAVGSGLTSDEDEDQIEWAMDQIIRDGAINQTTGERVEYIKVTKNGQKQKQKE